VRDGGVIGGEHDARRDEDGADTAVRGLPERDLQVVHLGEAADDGHAEPRVRAEGVHVDAESVLPEHLLGLCAGLVAEADAAVLDLDGDAVCTPGR